MTTRPQPPQQPHHSPGDVSSPGPVPSGVPGPAHGHGYGPAPGHDHVPDPGPGPGPGPAPAPAHGRGHGGHGGHGGGHGHVHAHGPAGPVSRHLRKVVAAVLIPFAAAVLAGLVVLWPGGPPGQQEDGRSGVGFDRPTYDARVTAVRTVDCAAQNVRPRGLGQQSDPGAGNESGHGMLCRNATVEVTSGPGAGRTFTHLITPDASRVLSAGQQVVVAYSENAPRQLQFAVIDVDRDLPIALLAAVFALVVILVGRLRGMLALVGLAVSFSVLTLFILPAILQGSHPLVVAVVGGSAIMLTTLYLCHGLSARTSVAALGTLVSLLLIGVLGSLFIDWARLTGNTDDQTGLVHGLYPDIKIQGLLLAGVLIGSLGVLDDVTVTQTSAVWELKEADPTAGWRRLYGAAMRIGRDHIASVVNTLVLAYAGAALPLLLLFTIAQSSVGTVAGSELVAEEIVRTLVGSIGLVASVPVTTLLAALVVSADRRTGGGAAGAAAGTAAATEGQVTSRRGRRRKKR